MVLVPHDKYEKLKKLQENQHTIDKNVSPEYDGHSSSGLIGDKVEATTPVGLHPMEKKTISEVKDKKSISTTDFDFGNTTSRKIDEILDFVPAKLQDEATVLLRYILKHTDISWDNNYSVSISGKTIEDSNIIDLVQDALLNIKQFTPTGMTDFYIALANIPISFIRNPKRRLLLKKGSGEEHLKHFSPPGLSNKSPLALSDFLSRSTDSNWKAKWLKIS